MLQDGIPSGIISGPTLQRAEAVLAPVGIITPVGAASAIAPLRAIKEPNMIGNQEALRVQTVHEHRGYSPGTAASMVTKWDDINISLKQLLNGYSP